MNRSFLEQVETPGALPPEELIQVQHLYEDLLLQTDSSKLAGRIARGYAEALLAVAEQRGQVDEIAEQIKGLGQVFTANPQFEEFLVAPFASKTRKEEVIRKTFEGRASDLFLDFLLMLNRKERLSHLRIIAIAYRTLLEQRANQVRVLVETAAPLTDEQRDKLRDTLATVLNKKPVLIVREVPDLIGGMVVHVGDRVFDTSVRSRLTSLRNQLLARGSHAIQHG